MEQEKEFENGREQTREYRSQGYETLLVKRPPHGGCLKWFLQQLLFVVSSSACSSLTSITVFFSSCSKSRPTTFGRSRQACMQITQCRLCNLVNGTREMTRCMRQFLNGSSYVTMQKASLLVSSLSSDCLNLWRDFNGPARETGSMPVFSEGNALIVKAMTF